MVIAPSRPDLTSSRAAACRAPLTPWLPTWKIRLCRSTAAMMSRPSSTVKVIGFSM